MPKKRKRKKERLEKAPRREEPIKVRSRFFPRVRLGLRLLALALFPFADLLQRVDLEWLALILLLGSALVFYEMLDFYRKIRQWRAFFFALAFYILAFGSLMLAISLDLSWAHSSNVALQLLLTLPRLIGIYYLCELLRQIYPYR